MAGVNDWSRFDAEARRAVVVSDLYARQANHPKITTEHLALALCTPPVAEYLIGMPPFEDLDRQLELQGVAPGTTTSSGHLPFDRQMRRVMDDTMANARTNLDDRIGPEHLLAALLRTTSAGAQALLALGADPTRSPAEWRREQSS